MNAIVPAGQFGPVSARFQGQKIENDLGAGIEGGFGLIGYKGKVWSIRKGGEEHQLMRDDGDGPRNSVELVILKASTVVSKIFYEQGYVEGSTSPPDCYSTNGVTPAAGAAKKQAPACAACPKNVWGSRITPAGKQGKACQDSKRLAVVPLNNIKNETFGGPLLLRVPAASLNDLKSYGAFMSSKSYPYYSIGTRVAFDPNESYPKFVLTAIRPLSDDEADTVLAMREGPEVARILAEDDFGQAQAAQVQAQPEKPLFEQATPASAQQAQRQTPAPSPAPATTAPKQAAQAVQPAPTQAQATHQAPQTVQQNVAPPPTQPTGVTDFDAELDKLLA